jgi:hypothetical protein
MTWNAISLMVDAEERGVVAGVAGPSLISVEESHEE